jgi:hypothetical protein
MRQRLRAGLRAIERCLKLDDLDGNGAYRPTSPKTMWVILATSSG